MAKARARVVVHGMVQGVGFRYSCRRQAVLSNVTGWVRNNFDGTVEAVFEGEKGDVQDMVDWCRSGPVSADVRRVDVAWEPPTGKFAAFQITFS